jgi:hypothetical protein
MSEDIQKIIAEMRELEKIYAEAHQGDFVWRNLTTLLDYTQELEEWKQNSIEDRRSIMREPCPSDEVHCTCVPALRQRVKELERELEDDRIDFMILDRRNLVDEEEYNDSSNGIVSAAVTRLKNFKENKS